MANTQEAALEEYLDLARFLVESLLEDDVEVEVKGKEGRDQLRIELHVPKVHRGRVIGRGGRIARAMRTILTNSGVANHQPVLLDIVD